ncbi:response regulator [Neptunicoccus sediminis]|uniref:response regulator n=1 Tax=Neptunicoccus sediminis TaxID=1892596 RepID=UPI000845D2C9|nr:response regulator [Neptunicoccus sediminis]
MTKLKRVLHVEDDEDIQEITKMALEVVGGMELAQYLDGHEALERIREFNPDLILLDQMMPNMTGDEVLAHIRQMPEFANTPAVFMTAQSSEASSQLMESTDALEIIPKPFNPMTLSTQLTEIWEAARSPA